jgi:hypothetical protein
MKKLTRLHTLLMSIGFKPDIATEVLVAARAQNESARMFIRIAFNLRRG